MVRLGYHLSLQQQQKLVMTPELRQALAVLQLPVTELEAYLQNALLENPVLEVRDGDEDGGAQNAADTGETAAAEGSEQQVDLLSQWLEYFGLEPPSDHMPRGDAREGRDDGLAGIAAAPAPTLQEHLMDQLRLLTLPRAERKAADFLVLSLDDNGYLTLPLAEAQPLVGESMAVVERALHVVQTLDPVGVGARSLEECLLLQWSVVGDGNALVPELIRSHLADLAAGRIARIAEVLGVQPAAVQEAADALRSLDPKPGRRFFQGSENRYIFPDVVVERVGHDYVVLVNDPGPRLTISASYRALLQGSCDAETRRFLETKFHSALWLLRSIEQRRTTLYRVTDAIVRLQRTFFDRGLRHLRPMTLRQVAQELGVHESTVSRATTGKYVQTPHGLFELKFFFASGVADGAGGVSAESVKRLIRDLIEAEDPLEPLSDQAVADALARQGVRISRRTVAKYREEANIANSALRKRYA